MSVFLLNDTIVFPNPRLAEPDGFLAIGGDLSVERLLLAYSQGIFPWYNEGEPICWWCPKERYIIRPEKIHISRSTQKFIGKHEIRVLFDRDFADTMHRCRELREHSTGTWITDDMEAAYHALHKAGYAMSVESLIDGAIAGGLYGVVIGRCFFGESMYTEVTNGSKLALIYLARFLSEKGFTMIDCQFRTDHLERMGGESISYEEYMELVRG